MERDNECPWRGKLMGREGRQKQAQPMEEKSDLHREGSARE